MGRFFTKKLSNNLICELHEASSVKQGLQDAMKEYEIIDSNMRHANGSKLVTFMPAFFSVLEQKTRDKKFLEYLPQWTCFFVYFRTRIKYSFHIIYIFKDLELNKGININMSLLELQIMECRRIMLECNDVSTLPNLRSVHSFTTKR